MKVVKKELLPIILVLLAFSVGIFLYPDLPDKMPSHWNAQGEIDGYAGKNFGVLFFPSIILAIYVLMTFIPLIDPLRKNYSKFASSYFLFKTLFVFFFTLLYFYTLAAALGTRFNINYLIIPAFSLFFILIGFFLPKIKKNYFVGIRTPWTLHSEEVWDKTHKIGGKLFAAAGIITLMGIFLPHYSFAILIVSILLAALGSTVYSYFVFRKEGGFNKSD